MSTWRRTWTRASSTTLWVPATWRSPRSGCKLRRMLNLCEEGGGGYPPGWKFICRRHHILVHFSSSTVFWDKLYRRSLQNSVNNFLASNSWKNISFLKGHGHNSGDAGCWFHWERYPAGAVENKAQWSLKTCLICLILSYLMVSHLNSFDLISSNLIFLVFSHPTLSALIWSCLIWSHLIRSNLIYLNLSQACSILI